MGEDAEYRRARETRGSIPALLSWQLVYAQPGQSADGPLSACDRVDADGRRISRQHVRSEPMPLLAARVSPTRLSHGPDRQMAHGDGYRLRPRLGLSDCLESAQESEERGRLLR